MNAIVSELAEFLNRGPGARTIYHIGCLARDKHYISLDGERRAKAKALGDAAKVALELSDAGKIHLTQRRLGTEKYEYIATRAR